MRIAISSRNKLFREGLACILKAREGCEIVALASTAKESLKSSGNKLPHVIVIDSQGAEQSDLDYILGAQLYHQFGLVLVAAEGEEAAGFEKVVRTNKSGFELVKAVRLASRKRPERRPARNAPNPDNPQALSPRETEIASMVAQGLSNKAIAEAAGIKEVTVKNFVALIMKKLGCNNRVQVALKLASRDKE